MAGFFGLVHGMAFSFTIVDLDLSTPQMIPSLLGFNLGIELIQLAIILAAMPALLMLARGRFYTPLRVCLACLALISAVGWSAARLGFENQVADLADSLGSIAPYVLVLLTSAGLLTIIGQRRSNQAA